MGSEGPFPTEKLLMAEEVEAGSVENRQCSLLCKAGGQNVVKPDQCIPNNISIQ